MATEAFDGYVMKKEKQKVKHIDEVDLAYVVGSGNFVDEDSISH
jgi:hypothetical protein